ncbi:MAG: hypothetical protein AAB590_01950 [Patescibacteria group bacterium]
MKTKIAFLPLFLAIILVPLSFVSAGKPSGGGGVNSGISIVSPNGGEVYTEGDIVNITWTAGKRVGDIWIGYFSAPNTLDWIATGLSNTGSYKWTVNVGNTTNTQFKIYISSNGGSDYSNNYFTVNQRVPALTFTADSASLPYNGSTTLRWNATDVTSCTATGAWSGSKTLAGSQAVGPLTSSRTYWLNCTGIYGSISKSVTITVAPAPVPTLALTPDDTSLAYGGETTIRWTSTNATSCSASGAWSGSKPTSGAYATGALTSSKTYTLICYGNGSSVVKSVSVSIAPAPAPTVALAADDSDLPYGGETTLRWISTNATSCAASGSWTGSKATTGEQATGRLGGGSRSFTLTCTGAGGSASSTVTVYVAPSIYPVPTVKLTAADPIVSSGNATTLNWTSTGAERCVAYGAWDGDVATSGSISTGALYEDHYYSITCYNPDNISNYYLVVVNVINGPVNLVPFAGTFQEMLDSGNSYVCYSDFWPEGKGPSSKYTYYLADGKVRREAEYLDGTTGTFFPSTGSYYLELYYPSIALYTKDYLNNTRTFYPGESTYESFAKGMSEPTNSVDYCSQGSLDPALFTLPL